MAENKDGSAGAAKCARCDDPSDEDKRMVEYWKGAMNQLRAVGILGQQQIGPYLKRFYDQLKPLIEDEDAIKEILDCIDRAYNDGFQDGANQGPD